MHISADDIASVIIAVLIVGGRVISTREHLETKQKVQEVHSDVREILNGKAPPNES